MTDPISDMLTQIRNALMAGNASVVLPHSKFKEQLANLLLRHGMLEEVQIVSKGQWRMLDLKLKYISGRPAIMGLKRISKPGQRIYSRFGDIPRTMSGIGMTVVSTSKGLKVDREARKEKLGGEIICQIW